MNKRRSRLIFLCTSLPFSQLACRLAQFHNDGRKGIAAVDMDHFPQIPHQRVGGGIDCPGLIFVEGPSHEPIATLRCDECGAVVGTINRYILSDLVNLTIDLDLWQPTAEGFNRLPGPLRDYIHDLETRADPAGEVQDLALARMTIAALQQRIRELEQTA